MEALKAFIKPYEAPQRIVKIKIWVNFFSLSGIVAGKVKIFKLCEIYSKLIKHQNSSYVSLTSLLLTLNIFSRNCTEHVINFEKLFTYCGMKFIFLWLLESSPSHGLVKVVRHGNHSANHLVYNDDKINEYHSWWVWFVETDVLQSHFNKFIIPILLTFCPHLQFKAQLFLCL